MTLSGHVTDPVGNNIANVLISLESNHIFTHTDNNGYFTLRLRSGTFNLVFEHIGYKKRVLKNIRSGQTDKIVVVLEPRILNVEGMVITATRSERSIYEIPAPLNVVSQIEIRRSNAKTTAEVLREETGIFVQKTNHGGGSAIIRGLSSNQILILVDGIRLNNSTYRLGNHQYLTTVDQNMLHKAEVVRGPASVLYGSDALGGTINLITANPAFTAGKVAFHYGLSGRLASADNERTTRGEFSLKTSRLAFQGGLSLKSFNDLRRGKNSDYPELENSTNGLKQSPSGYNSYDFDAKFIYRLSATRRMIMAHQQTSQIKVPRYDKYENNNYFRWIYHPQKRALTYLVYENQTGAKYVRHLSATLSYHRQQEGREIEKTAEARQEKEKDTVHTLGLTLQSRWWFDPHELTMGAEFYGDKIYSERFIIDEQTAFAQRENRGRYPDGAEYKNMGIFLQDEIQLCNNLRSIAGVRYSYISTNFSQAPDNSDFGTVQQSFQAITSSVGLVYHMAKPLYLNANMGQAFRAPNLSDIGKLGESKGDIYEVPNPDLEPEKMLSFDLGVKINSDRVKAAVSLYHARITDLVASDDAVYKGQSLIEKAGDIFKVKAKQNIGRAFIRGLETSLDFHILDRCSMYGHFTYTHGQNSTLDEPVGGIPPAFGLMGLKYYFDFGHLYFYVRYAAKQDRLSADDLDDPRIPPGGTPGWQTYNLRTGFSLAKFINLQIAVENILDYNYREHGSGINGPGRNFILGIEWAR